MSQFVSDEQIILEIKQETEKLNKCITEWYNETFPDDLDDFKGCCDTNEINILVKCYNIFSKNNNLQSLDYDFIKALLMYYYVIVVFEYYVDNLIVNKYLKIVSETKSSNPREKDVYYFKDNDGNTYTYNWNRRDDGFFAISIKGPQGQIFYAAARGRKNNPYIYKDSDLSEAVISKYNMNCLENILTTEQSKEYYELLYKGDADWISQIRRLILNMNTDLFEGHKGGKKLRNKIQQNTKKNKRNHKKYIKKSRKNKGKKRTNKIKYTKK